MSNPRDNGPLAPRRSLSKAGASSSAPTPGPGASNGMAPRETTDAPTQPVMTPPYGGNPQPYSAVEIEPGRTFPVPPAPGDQAGHRAPENQQPQIDERALKAERRAAASRPRTVRRAKLRLMRIDPWSVTKVSLLLSIAFGIMCVVAVFLIFSIMDAAGLWTHVNETIQGVLNQKASDRFDINDYVGMDRVMGITMLISAIDVVLITALATLSAFIYNMAASLLGGIEVTLAEDVK
jgi:Transmembrane domain of unknown function (DUF3566)